MACRRACQRPCRRACRRALLSTASAFILATAIIILAYRLYSYENQLIFSASIALENKKALYLARNVEETFWQTLSETAEACLECEQEELAVRASGNVALWKSFWEKELGEKFFGFPEFSVSARATEQRDLGRRHYSFSITRPGFSIPVSGNRTIAFLGGGEERGCTVLLSNAPSCSWD